MKMSPMPDGMYELLAMQIQDRFDAAPNLERPSPETGVYEVLPKGAVR